MKHSKELQSIICNDYSNEKTSIETLLEKYKLSPNTLYRILKKNNVSKRSFHSPCRHKSNVNENYFETIDSPDKAYWLGFLTAKAHIYHISENFARLQLNLPIEDLYHLEKFKIDLATENKITITKIKDKEICKISINSINLCNSLKNYGTDLFQTNEILMSDYIRGIIDGNGYFYISKITNQINFRFTFPLPDFISQFKDYLINSCYLDSNKQIYFKNNKYQINFYGDIQVKKIIKYIYSNCFLKLERKYEYCKNYFDIK